MPGRLPQNLATIKPRVVGKFRVQNAVLTGTKEKSTGICLSEMQQVFLCFKNYSFNEEACAKEIAAFKLCFGNHVTARKMQADSNTSGKAVAENTTKLLQRFPERNKDKL